MSIIIDGSRKIGKLDGRNHNLRFLALVDFFASCDLEGQFRRGRGQGTIKPKSSHVSRLSGRASTSSSGSRRSAIKAKLSIKSKDKMLRLVGWKRISVPSDSP